MAYVVRRLLASAPSLGILSVVVFMLLHLAPGDPTILITGPLVTDEVYDRTRQQLGLDEPLPIQYWRYMSRVGQGDLGDSLLYKRPTVDLIWERLPKTLLLSLGALVVCYLLGVPAGVLAAVRRGSPWDAGVMATATLGLAIPGFWLGLMLIILFAVNLGWFPASGYEGGRSYVLPIITLGVGEAAGIARIIRSSMLEHLGADYVQTARAKGLRDRVIVVRHALRNALLPTLSVLGLQLGFLLSGAVVVESVFGWPGLGRLLVDSILNKDFQVVQGVLLIIGTMIVIGNLLADVLYRMVDPRVSLT